MDEVARARSLQAKLDKKRLDFVRVELEMGITFMNIANTTTNPVTRVRNIDNARKAHDAGVHFLAEVVPCRDSTRKQIERTLQELGSLLDEISASSVTRTAYLNLT